LTGDALTPFNSLESELETEFNSKYSNNHIIQPDQFKIMVCNKGINKRDFEFIWTQRTNSYMFIELGETILDLAKVVPGGIILVVPSFPFLGTLNKVWTEKTIFTKINQHKKIFWEVKNDKSNKQAIDEFEFFCENGGGLFVVV